MYAESSSWHGWTLPYSPSRQVSNKASGPSRLSAVLGGVTLVFLISGCGGGSSAGPEVVGTVKVDGKPPAAGRIVFARKGGTTAEAGLDSNGYYRLMSSYSTPGAEPGSYTVNITITKPGDNAVYSLLKEKQLEITSSGGTFDFLDLTSSDFGKPTPTNDPLAR